MSAADWIVVAVVVLIIGSVIGYIVREKRRGVKCIGCPSGKTCKAHKTGNESDCCCNCK